MKSKVLAASAVSLLLLTSCGQPAIKQDADPAQVLKDARMNFVKSATAYAEKTSSGTAKGTLEANLTNPDAKAKITGSLDASSADQKEFDITLNLKGDVESSATGKINGEVSLGARLVAKNLYANLMKVDAKAEQAALQTELETYLQAAKMFSNKWIKFDLAQLAGADAAALDQALSMNNLEATKKALAKFGDHEIFTLKEKLPSEEGMYVYKVVPNKEGLVALMKAMVMEIDASAQFTPEDQAGLEQVIDALSADNVTHKLYIDGEFHYRKLVSTGTVNTPEIKADITSTLTTDKDMNGGWVLDVKANNPAGSENFTLNVKSESKNMNSSIDLKFDAPFMNTKFDMMVKSAFSAGTPKIEVPADAVDFTQLMGGSAMTGTGAALPANQ